MCDVSDIYPPTWQQNITTLRDTCQYTQQQLPFIEVGATHTMALTTRRQCYTWGWNDYSQLGRPTTYDHVDVDQDGHRQKPGLLQFQEKTAIRPKYLSAGEDHNLIVDTDNNLFIFGQNTKG